MLAIHDGCLRLKVFLPFQRVWIKYEPSLRWYVIVYLYCLRCVKLNKPGHEVQKRFLL